jgi:hypothetical protein
MSHRRAIAVAVILVLGAGTPGARGADPAPEVVVDSIASPRNLAFDANGDLYIPSAGTGGSQSCAFVDEGYMCSGLTGAIYRVRAAAVRAGGATPEALVTGLPSMALPGGGLAHGVHGIAARNGKVYAVFISKEFLGTEHTNQCCRSDVQGPLLAAARHFLGNLMEIGNRGRLSRVADVSAFEYAHNPVNDQHSNPYAVAPDRDGSFLVADAAANTLLRVRPNGRVELVAVFDNVYSGPGPTWTEAVPTGVVVGPDGNYYVSFLGSFHPTFGRIVQVTRGGVVRTVADGLSTVSSIAVSRDGTLYATELVPGDLIRLRPNHDQRGTFGPPEFLYRGQLTAPSGVAVGPDGRVYISDRGVAPDSPMTRGRIVRVPA